MPYLLVIEDESETRHLIAEIAEEEGYDVDQAGDIRQARILIERRHPDVILLDMHLPDGNGMELWQDLKLPNTDVVFVTGHSTVDSAIEALRCGAIDYLQKPVSLRRLKMILAQIKGAVQSKPQSVAGAAFEKIIGKSPAIHVLRAHIEKVAPTTATVLLVGESGVYGFNG